MTPDEYCQQRSRAERLELLLQLPVPAARAPARDHGALRVLPRGRRRRRRESDPERRPRRSSRGGAARSAPSFAGTPQHPVALALHPVVARLPLPQDAFPDGDRRDGDGSRAQPLPRLRRPRALLPSRRRRRRPHVGGDLRLRESGDARTTPAISASRSSSPTSSATSARMRAAAASTCRRTSSRATASRVDARCSSARTSDGLVAR